MEFGRRRAAAQLPTRRLAAPPGDAPGCTHCTVWSQGHGCEPVNRNGCIAHRRAVELRGGLDEAGICGLALRRAGAVKWQILHGYGAGAEPGHRFGNASRSLSARERAAHLCARQESVVKRPGRSSATATRVDANTRMNTRTIEESTFSLDFFAHDHASAAAVGAAPQPARDRARGTSAGPPRVACVYRCAMGPEAWPMRRAHDPRRDNATTAHPPRAISQPSYTHTRQSS